MLRYEVRGAVAWLTIDRPEKLNAMTRAFFGELRAALDEADGDERVRAAVVHGAGPCFSVGGDLDGFAALRDEADRLAYLREAIGALVAVERAATPTVAAVHGAALGGGCELTIVCDVVVADATARFGTPEGAVGLVPGLGVLRGRTNLNAHWLKYMILTGEPLDAEQARLAGLAQVVTAAGGHLDAAGALAERIAARSPRAAAAAKAHLGAGAADRLEEAVALVAGLMAGPDLAEGVAAFRERRPPAFGHAGG